MLPRGRISVEISPRRAFPFSTVGAPTFPKGQGAVFVLGSEQSLKEVLNMSTEAGRDPAQGLHITRAVLSASLSDGRRPQGLPGYLPAVPTPDQAPLVSV